MAGPAPQRPHLRPAVTLQVEPDQPFHQIQSGRIRRLFEPAQDVCPHALKWACLCSPGTSAPGLRVRRSNFALSPQIGQVSQEIIEALPVGCALNALENRLPTAQAGANVCRPIAIPMYRVNNFDICCLTSQQSADLYHLIIGRHRVSSFVVTPNTAVGERLNLLNDPILGNSALDGLANDSYRKVIEGTGYRERLSPYQKLLAPEEVFDPRTRN